MVDERYLKTVRAGGPHAENLVGKQYGKLKVTRRTTERQNGIIVYKCTCDCVNLRRVRSTVLRAWGATSCGRQGACRKD
jgi:hypothetical protein